MPFQSTVHSQQRTASCLPSPQSTIPPSAAIYLRVSTDEQAREGVSLAAQEARCRDYCHLVGLSVHQVYSDAAVSGSVPLSARPAAARLLADVASGAGNPACPPFPSPSPSTVHSPQSTIPSAVVAIKLDRLFRNTLDALSHIERWDAQGISLHLLDFGGQALDTRSAVGRMFLTVAAAFAQFERDLTAERTVAALSHIASTGRMPTGAVFGYDRKAGALVINETEAAIVREIFARFAAGASINEITRALAAAVASGAGNPACPAVSLSPSSRAALPRRRGGQGGEASLPSPSTVHRPPSTIPPAVSPKYRGHWRHTGVRRILRSPVYLGAFRHQGDVLQGTHEPLVDPEQWQRVQDRLDLHATNSGRRPKTLALLFRCGLCGGGMAGQRQAYTLKHTGEVRYHERLRCYAAREAAATHEPVSLNATAALDAIYQATEALLTQGDWQAALREASGAGNPACPAVSLPPSPASDSSLITHHSSLPSPSPSPSRLSEIAALRRANMTAFHAALLTMADVKALNAPLVAEERALRRDATCRVRRAPALDLDALLGQNAQDLVRALRASDVETQLSVLLALWEPVQAYPNRQISLTSRLLPSEPLTIALPARTYRTNNATTL